MASRKFDYVNSLTKRAIILAGSFQCQGTGAPTILSGTNSFTVTRTGTGTYTIQFADNYAGIGYAQTFLVQATPADVANIVDLKTTSTTPGAYINLKIGAIATPATGADLTQTGDDCVQFIAFLRNSSINS
jgi:hypothetical protein